MEQGEQQYIKGFNHGYLLAEHEPVLLAQVTKTLEPKNDYLSGLFSGKEEYELEHSIEQLNEISSLRNRSKGLERDMEKE